MRLTEALRDTLEDYEGGLEAPLRRGTFMGIERSPGGLGKPPRGYKCISPRSNVGRREHSFDKDGNCLFCPGKQRGRQDTEL